MNKDDLRWIVIWGGSVAAILIIGSLINGGLKSSKLGQIRSLGHHFEIACYSGGQLVYQGDSEGQPSNENSSDGFYFTDNNTGKLVEVAGTCIFREK